MTGRSAESAHRVDIVLKVFSIFAICFGGWSYFKERDEVLNNQALSRSLSYIEEYGSERYVNARLSLHAFWGEHPELVQLLSAGGISDRVYRSALAQDVFRQGKDLQISEALILLDNFYSQVAFCHDTALCDATILEQFFCPVAQSEAVAYAPFFDNMTSKTGDRDLGRELEDFSTQCAIVSL